jgi:hypothetical protein
MHPEAELNSVLAKKKKLRLSMRRYMIQFDTPVWNAILSEAETAKVDECFIVVAVEVPLVDPSIILSLAS